MKWVSLKNPYCSFCLENFLALSLPPKLVLIFQDPAQTPPFPGSLPWISQPNELTLPWPLTPLSVLSPCSLSARDCWPCSSSHFFFSDNLISKRVKPVLIRTMSLSLCHRRLYIVGEQCISVTLINVIKIDTSTFLILLLVPAWNTWLYGHKEEKRWWGLQLSGWCYPVHREGQIETIRISTRRYYMVSASHCC